jgi:nitroimidazol reductase NimA-like FMN-containing flavoprotein (pyridoxamine 5'-phosphate oxidase superfamily)
MRNKSTMLDLKPDEIYELLERCDWGTLLVVDENKPYGIEVSHYVSEGKIYFIINPRGKAATCMEKNPHVAYKVCKANLPQQRWSAATVEGSVEQVREPQAIRDAFMKLAERLNRDRDRYKKLGEKFSHEGKASPVYYLPIATMSGKASQKGFFPGDASKENI